MINIALSPKTLRIIGYVTLGLVLFFYIHGTGTQNNLDEFITTYSAQLKNDHQLLAEGALAKNKAADLIRKENAGKEVVTSLQKTNSSLQDKVQKTNSSLQTLADSLHKLEEASLDSVGMAREIIPVLQATVDTQKSLLVLKDSTIDNQAKQIYTYQFVIVPRADSATAIQKDRAEKAEKALAILPKPPKNPDKVLGFIPLPSRTLVGVVGLIGGVVGGFQIGIAQNHK